MKHAIALYHGTTRSEVWLLESVEDIIQYGNYERDGFMRTLPVLLKTDKARWDHLATRRETSVLGAAITRMTITGENAIWSFSGMLQEKLLNMTKHMLEEGQIIVNSRGGYCWPGRDIQIVEVLGDVDTDFDPYAHTVINDNTKIINLENDPELEQYSIDYMSKLDPNYSYITELKSFSRDMLVQAFKDFRDAGGDTAFVYTTGLDEEQMIQYTSAAGEAHIRNLVIHLNAGPISDETTNELNEIANRRNMKLTIEQV